MNLVGQFFILHTDDLILPEVEARAAKIKAELQGVQEVTTIEDEIVQGQGQDNVTKSRTANAESGADKEFSMTKKKKKRETLAESLMSDFSELPKKAKTDEDEYAVIHVSPSVVPNPYLPSFRVWSFNISGALPSSSSTLLSGPDAEDGSAKKQAKTKEDKIAEGLKRDHGHRHGKKGGVDCSKKDEKNTWACRPKKPYFADENSPSRRNQLWTPLGYAQVSKACVIFEIVFWCVIFMW